MGGKCMYVTERAEQDEENQGLRQRQNTYHDECQKKQNSKIQSPIANKVVIMCAVVTCRFLVSSGRIMLHAANNLVFVFSPTGNSASLNFTLQNFKTQKVCTSSNITQSNTAAHAWLMCKFYIKFKFLKRTHYPQVWIKLHISSKPNQKWHYPVYCPSLWFQSETSCSEESRPVSGPTQPLTQKSRRAFPRN